jgi:hypothetical protein
MTRWAGPADLDPAAREGRQAARDAVSPPARLYLKEYLEAVSLESDAERYLFRSTFPRTGELTDNALAPADVYR